MSILDYDADSIHEQHDLMYDHAKKLAVPSLILTHVQGSVQHAVSSPSRRWQLLSTRSMG